MEIKLQMRIDKGKTHWHIDLVAENKGEQAILHLMQEGTQTLSIERGGTIHPSYLLMEKVTLYPQPIVHPKP